MADNLFNTFSFNLWKKANNEAEAAETNKAKRKLQVKKLKKALKQKKIGAPTKQAATLDAASLQEVLQQMMVEDSGNEYGLN